MRDYEDYEEYEEDESYAVIAVLVSIREFAKSAGENQTAEHIDKILAGIRA